MATDTSAGFEYYGRSGNTQSDTVRKFIFKDTEKLYKGDLLNVESGEVDLAATADTALIGIANQTVDGTDSVTEIECIVDPDAVYSVYDANARSYGDTLDIAGSAGAMTVAASVNADLIVVGGLLDSERTLVMINHGSHLFN